MVGHFPHAVFAHENVGRRDDRVADTFQARHPAHVARQHGGHVALCDRRRLTAAQNRVPAVQNCLTSDQDRTAGVNARYRVLSGPQVFHGVNVAADEGGVESIVGEKDFGFFAKRHFYLCFVPGDV